MTFIVFFSAADIFAAPYVDGTQSGAVRAALGFGLPIVATSIGDLPDIITPEIGVLTAPRDAAALAEAIGRCRPASSRSSALAGGARPPTTGRGWSGSSNSIRKS